MKKRMLGATLFLMYVSIFVAAKAETYALLVGINNYQAAFRPLNYAEDDARLMRDTLVGPARVPEENVKMLLGAAATRAAIAKELVGWLATRVRPNDTAIFFFSGHGAYMTDDDNDEADGLDELLCAYDSSSLSDLTFIRDDALNTWLREIPCAAKVVVLDACHSGTGSKAIYEGGNRVKAANINGREIKSAPAETRRAVQAELDSVAPRGAAPPSGSRVLELAACRPDQVSMESGALKHGVLTYYVAEGARGAADANKDTSVTLGELREYAARRMRERGFTQEPQVNGDNGEAFALVAPKTLVVESAPAPEPQKPAAATPAPAVAQKPEPPKPILAPQRVLEVGDGALVLSVGANHGVVTGATYRVFPHAGLAADGNVPADAKPLGTLRINAVEPNRSQAEFVWEPFEIAPNDAVVLHERPVESDRLVVRVLADDDAPASPETGAFLDALRTAVAAMPDARLADATDAADRLLIGAIRRDTATPVAEVTLANPNRALAAKPLMLARFDSPQDAARTLAEQVKPSLVAAFTKKALAAVENPDSPLRIGFRGPESARVGDTVSFSFTPSRDGYLLLVNVATDGSLYVLYPNGFATENAVRAGETVTVPDARWQVRVAGPRGQEVVKAIFTTSPMTLDGLDAERLRRENLFGLPASESGALLRRIAVDILRNRPVTEWAAEAVAFPVSDGSRDPIELSSLE